MLDTTPDTGAAVWIAKFPGPIFVVLSTPMIVMPARLQETTRGYLADRPLILVSGVLAMTAGLSIVNTRKAKRENKMTPHHALHRTRSDVTRIACATCAPPVRAAERRRQCTGATMTDPNHLDH